MFQTGFFIGPLLGAFILQRGGYEGLYYGCAALALISAGLMFRLPRRRRMCVAELVIEPDQTWEVDLFRLEDAEGVARLFLQVYGDGYPIKTFIDPFRLIEENNALRTISVVARTPKGDIVGHNAMFNSAPFPGLYESGAGLVHPQYRGGAGIFARMNSQLLELGKNRFKIAGLFGESVCNHVFPNGCAPNWGR